MPLSPCRPIEDRRPSQFQPPHCPWEDCSRHLPDGRRYRAWRHGFYRRSFDVCRVPRFRCPSCRRTFSRQTFATTYRLKRPDLLRTTASLLVSGAANRQIARHVGCAPSTVMRLGVRLGQHAELFQADALSRIEAITEPIVFDHFETFVRTQVDRLAIGTAVGHRSWFVFPIQGARYRGAVRRARNKRPLQKAPAPTVPGAIVESTRRLLEPLFSKASGQLQLESDDHPAYRSAVVRAARPTGGRWLHRIHRNPVRRTARDRLDAKQRDSAMFPVDLLHKLIRHCQAHHRRETIAFGRKGSNVLGRASLLAVWRNFIKRTTERRPCRTTPAIQLGLADRPWSWTDVLARRLFARHIA